MYSKHPIIRTPTGRKNLFEIANVRIIGWILKENSRKGIKHPFELSDVELRDAVTVCVNTHTQYKEYQIITSLDCH